MALLNNSELHQDKNGIDESLRSAKCEAKNAFEHQNG